MSVKVPNIVENTIYDYITYKFNEEEQEKKIKFYSMVWQKNTELLEEYSINFDIDKIRNKVMEDENFYSKAEKFFSDFNGNLNIHNLEELNEFFRNIFENFFKINQIVDTPIYIENELVEKLDMNLLKSAVKEGDKYKTYACCHHSYLNINSIPYSTIVSGKCYRCEKYNNEFRKSEFNMIELVSFNKQNILEKMKAKLLYLFTKVAELITNERYKLSVANDSFVTDNPELLLFQFLNKSKIELKVYSKKYDEYIAVGSINMHNNYFSKKFNILNENSTLTSSMCAAFGLDRILEVLKIKNNEE